MTKRTLPSTVCTIGIAVLASGIAFLAGSASAQQKSVKEQLVGTWTFVSWEAVRADGSKTQSPEGANPKGILMFDSGGRFSLQIMTERLPFKSGSQMTERKAKP